MDTLGYVTILIFLLLIASVGFVFKAFNRDISDYFRGGCRGTWWLVGASAFMSSFSTWTFTGAAGVAFEAGWSVAAIFLGNAAGYLLNFLWFAPWYRQLRATTAPEIVRMRFDGPTQQTYAGLGILLGLLQGGLHLFGLAIFCSAVFGLPAMPLIIVLGIVVVVYSVSGGSWAVMATDFLQGLILLPITLLASWVALDALGGVSGMVEHIHELGLSQDFQPVKSTGQYAAEAFTWGWISAVFVKNMITWNTMGAGVKYFSVKDGREARKAALLCAIVMLLGSLIWFLPPMAGRLLFADQILAMPLNKPAESAYAVTCLNLLPSGLTGLLVVAMFAATMSSMDTGLNRNAAVLIKDVYPALCRLFGKRPRDEGDLLGASRLVSLFFGAGIIGTALYFARSGGEGIFNAMLNIGSYLATPMVIPMFFGMLIRRTPQWSALAAVAGGLLCSIGLAVSRQSGVADWNFQQVFFINAGITLAIFLLSRLAWGQADPAYRRRLRGFFTRMHTPVDFEREVGGANDLSQLLIIGGFALLIGVLVLVLPFFEPVLSDRLETIAVGGFVALAGAAMFALGWHSKRNR